MHCSIGNGTTSSLSAVGNLTFRWTDQINNVSLHLVLNWNLVTRLKPQDICSSLNSQSLTMRTLRLWLTSAPTDTSDTDVSTIPILRAGFRTRMQQFQYPNELGMQLELSVFDPTWIKNRSSQSIPQKLERSTQVLCYETAITQEPTPDS